ncbi:MAG: prepilin-type N-terminal cleavage/methylation domain-containing protein [Pyrinomonadaceae bacterium]|nr:prepilin-type N-terminal cleavage/methylation domain-containing protein [Pyrinomonadaceae bacterium]
MANANRGHATSLDRGFSLIELLIVLALVGVMTAVAVPQMIAQRRAMRSNAVVREIATQMRYARQMAMSQQQAVTFQYDNVTKEIKIFDHNNSLLDFRSGTAVLVSNGGQLNTGAPATVAATVSLAQGGVAASEIEYGIPATLPTTALGDGISMTALYQNKFTVTFQADGSVVNPAGIPWSTPPVGVAVSQAIPMDRAMFIYNTKAIKGSAAAISVLGASGRIKVWRYNDSANKYQE